MALTTPYPYDAQKNPPIQIVEGLPTDPYIVINKVINWPSVPTAQLDSSIVKENIANVYYVFEANPGNAYPWPTKTRLCFEMVNGTMTDFELQTVENKPTWNLGTLAACTQAVTDINASL